jgi:hypothetical protein
MSLSVALAAPLAQGGGASAASPVWPALLSLLLATIGVERAIEIIWNYLEWLLLAVLKWADPQLKTTHYLQFKSGTSLVFGVILGILLTNLTGLRLFAYLQPLAPGLLVGIAPAWDILITGLIIGSGAKPVHDLLGIITQLKNLLAHSAIRQREAAGAALAEGVLKLAQSEAQATVDIPGIGPARLMGNARGFTEDDEAAVEEKSTTERYVELLRNRTLA